MLHTFRLFFLLLIKKIISLVPKKKGLILFSAWFGKKFIDSPMFVYEFFLENNCYSPVWFTRNKELYLSLLKQHKPTVYAYSLQGIWLQIRAQMLISSVQFADFNQYLLSNCIFLDLDHGFPIKQSGFDIPNTSKKSVNYVLSLRTGIEYYMSASSIDVMMIISKAFRIDKEHIVLCNKARTDVFFDYSLRSGLNSIVDKYKNGNKAIVYMPTHRSEGSEIISVEKILDLKRIQEICMNHNAVFLIKKHFYHMNERENLEMYSRIFDISNEDIEPETLLYQADMLITDYSACYIDYLLLNRPVVFFVYDYEDFIINEREMYFDFEDNTCGFRPKTADELCESIEQICIDKWIDFRHEVDRAKVRNRYFDSKLKLGKSREHIKIVIDDLIESKFETNWE